MRLRVICDFDWDATDTEDDEEDDRVELDIHARAHREIAFSTPADIAPRRPPKTDRLELELEEVEDEEDGIGDGDLGGVGGVPR